MDPNSKGWGLVPLTSSDRFSPISDADPDPIGLFATNELSDDDVPLSQVALQSDPQCDTCRLTFEDIVQLKKHLKRYRSEHKYYKCCNVVRKGNHLCKPNAKGKLKFKLANGGKPFNCLKCSLSFTREMGLKTHVRFVHKERMQKCKICEETLQNESELADHMAMHSPEDKVICRNCKTEFSSLKHYRTHASLYPNHHNFKCKSCSRKFYTEVKLEEHVCIFTNGQPLLCACGKEFSSYTDVVEHAKGPKQFHCCTCSHITSSLTCYIRHVRKHTSQKPYDCKFCILRLSSQEQLKIHTKNVHGLEDPSGCSKLKTETKLDTADEENVICLDCGKAVRSSRLIAHSAKHNRSSCLCPDCGKMFDSHFKLTQHMLSTHNSQPVTCDICNRVLKTKKILQEHLKTHLTTEIGKRVAQAICPHCGLELAQKGSLSRHILLVHERHRLVQNDEPRLCRDCGMYLPNKAKYYTHRRQHRAMVERFPCPVCLREFNKKQNLVRHMYLIHDSTRASSDCNYTCEMCPRVFRERKNMIRHYRLVHKILDQPV